MSGFIQHKPNPQNNPESGETKPPGVLGMRGGNGRRTSLALHGRHRFAESGIA